MASFRGECDMVIKKPQRKHGKTNQKMNYVSIKHFFFLLASAITAWYYNLPEVIHILFWAMGLDMFFGIANALSRRRKAPFNFNKSFISILKKIGCIVIVVFCYKLDIKIKKQVGDVATLFYIAHYALSGLNNAVKWGVPVPAPLREILASMERGVKAKESSADSAPQATPDPSSME